MEDEMVAVKPEDPLDPLAPDKRLDPDVPVPLA
jgi:hypothetical protein